MRAGAVGLSAVVCCWVAAAGQGQAKELSPKESAAEQELGGVFSKGTIYLTPQTSRGFLLILCFGDAWNVVI